MGVTAPIFRFSFFNSCGMNHKKPLVLTVPVKAKKHLHEALKSQPPTFKFERENFYWIIDLIITFASLRDIKKLKSGGFVSISSTYLNDHISNNVYAKYIGYLEEIGIILCDHSYSIERGIPMGYKIVDEFLSDIDIEADKVFIHSSASIWKKVEQQRKSKQSHQKIPEEMKLLKKSFNDTGFDFEGARDFILNMEIRGKNKDLKRRVYLKCIDNLEDKKKSYFHISDSNGRLNSNYTNLLKELRQFINGDKIIIDLSNSQPYFLSQIFCSLVSGYSETPASGLTYNVGSPQFEGLRSQLRNLPIINYNEVLDFSERCRNGSIYEFFTSKMGEGFKREKVKKKFLSMLYADNSCWFYKRYEDVFKECYPSLYCLTRHLKLIDNSQLPIAMQKIEADVFIHHIASKLIRLGVNVLTIHDSVVVDRDNYTIAIGVMENTFLSLFGNVPKLKVTNLDDTEFNPIDEVVKLLSA